MPSNHLIFYVPFSSCLQSFLALGSFPVSQFFASGGQSIRVSASASVLPMNNQDWSPLRWTDWISLQSRDSQESSPTPQFKGVNSLALSFLYSPTLTSNLDSIFKSRDITLPTKVRLVKAKVFHVVMYGCESWTIKRAECQRTDAFELWCRRRLLRVPWTAKRSNSPS